MYYTVRQVAAIFNCNPETVKRHIYKGKIKAIKFGGEWRISEQEVERIKRGE